MAVQVRELNLLRPETLGLTRCLLIYSHGKVNKIFLLNGETKPSALSNGPLWNPTTDKDLLVPAAFFGPHELMVSMFG